MRGPIQFTHGAIEIKRQLEHERAGARERKRNSRLMTVR